MAVNHHFIHFHGYKGCFSYTNLLTVNELDHWFLTFLTRRSPAFQAQSHKARGSTISDLCPLRSDMNPTVVS